MVDVLEPTLIKLMQKVVACCVTMGFLFSQFKLSPLSQLFFFLVYLISPSITVAHEQERKEYEYL